MKTRYIVNFRKAGEEAKPKIFLATSLLDLFEQVSDWKGNGEHAPVYDDEILSISEA